MIECYRRFIFERASEAQSLSLGVQRFCLQRGSRLASLFWKFSIFAKL